MPPESRFRERASGFHPIRDGLDEMSESLGLGPGRLYMIGLVGWLYYSIRLPIRLLSYGCIYWAGCCMAPCCLRAKA